MKLDPIAKFNRKKWNELVAANVQFSRPWGDLTPRTARPRLDPEGVLGNVKGKKVLCLANGGGQQSIAFALLGAKVTVVDLSDAQLARDIATADKMGLNISTRQMDMRDLSFFKANTFDIVWQMHSMNFMPDYNKVLAGVARILKNRGFYRLQLTNPYAAGIDEDAWDGKCYPLMFPYIDGEVKPLQPAWHIWNNNVDTIVPVGPRAFRHTLETILNGFVRHGFVIRKFWEETCREKCKPGTWGHFMSIIPPHHDYWLQLSKPRKK